MNLSSHNYMKNFQDSDENKGKVFFSKFKFSNLKISFKTFFIKLSGAFMLPISIMALAGLFLGIGSFLVTNQDPSSVTAHNHTMRVIGLFLLNIGKPIYQAMPLIIALAIVVAFTEASGVAVFSTVLGYLTFCLIQSAFISDSAVLINNKFIPQPEKIMFNRGINFQFQHAENIFIDILGVKVFNTGILGGILIGLISSWVNNKFLEINFTNMFAFFQGKRFIPIMTIITMLPLALFFIIIWPYIAHSIENLSYKIVNMRTNPSLHQNAGPEALSGFMQRFLMIFGLRGIFELDLESFVHATSKTNKFSFSQGEYPISILIMPAAALAMIFASPKGRKEFTFGALLPATITSFFTGITEPLEFSFIFLSPILFLFETVFSTISYVLMAKFGADVQNFVVPILNHSKMITSIPTYVGGGIIDLLSLVLRDSPQYSITKWWLIFVTGVPTAIFYGFIFYIIVKFLRIPTIGRGIEEGYIKVTTLNSPVSKERPYREKPIKLSPEERRALEKTRELLVADELKRLIDIKSIKETEPEMKKIQKIEIRNIKQNIKEIKSKSREELRGEMMQGNRARVISSPQPASRPTAQPDVVETPRSNKIFLQPNASGDRWDIIRDGVTTPIFSAPTQVDALKQSKLIPELEGQNVTIMSIDGEVRGVIKIKNEG